MGNTDIDKYGYHPYNFAEVIFMPCYSTRDTEVCGNCIHFRQHYVKWGIDYYHPLQYGHCTFPRTKKREAGDTCPHWKAVLEE